MARTIGIETAQKLAAVWDSSSSLRDAARRAGIKTTDDRSLRRYRRIAEEILNITLPSHNPQCSQGNMNWPTRAKQFSLDHEYSVLFFSDAHLWPSETSQSFWLMLEVAHDIKDELAVIHDNGDSFDGATISRHPPSMWEDPPTLEQEYEAVLAHQELIEEAVGEDVLRFRSIGNHDMRFESLLAKTVPQVRGMPGTTIGELFPRWDHNYSFVYQDQLMAKHRFRGGVHAAWNNVLHSGVNMVTSHTHRLGAREFTDFRGTRVAIETGTLANPYGPQFEYCEDNPRNWQQGFVVVTFEPEGHIHYELVKMRPDGSARFRGKVYRP